MIRLFTLASSKKVEMSNVQDLDTKCKFELQFNDSMRSLEDHITSISRSNSEFYKFAYELRKIDIQNQFTFEFLNGQVKPHCIVEMICANQWDTNSQTMKFNDKSYKFRLASGMEGQRLVCELDKKG